MVIKQEKFTRIIRGNVKQTVQPKCVILEVVKLVETGNLSVREASTQYEVGPVTVKNWLKKYSRIPGLIQPKKRIPKEEKRKVVREIEQGITSRKEAAQYFQVDYSTINHWVSEYSCKVKTVPTQMQELTTIENRLSSTAQDENKQLKFTVKELELKVAALETILDLAEKEFRLDIRKNFGTKQ
jgi:transposase-like protein